MGRIKKILENDLVGGIGNTDVYPVTATKAVYNSENKNLEEILHTISNVINVDIIAPLDSGYYTSNTARSAVPLKYRVLGLIITYRISATTSIIEQFIGSTTLGWTIENNWANIGSGSGNLMLNWSSNVATTRKQVPLKLRKSGLQISYKLNNISWVNEQYIGSSYTDTEWVKDINWNKIATENDITEAKVTNSYTDMIINSKHISFNAVAEQTLQNIDIKLYQGIEYYLRNIEATPIYQNLQIYGYYNNGNNSERIILFDNGSNPVNYKFISTKDYDYLQLKVTIKSGSSNCQIDFDFDFGINIKETKELQESYNKDDKFGFPVEFIPGWWNGAVVHGSNYGHVLNIPIIEGLKINGIHIATGINGIIGRTVEGNAFTLPSTKYISGQESPINYTITQDDVSLLRENKCVTIEINVKSTTDSYFTIDKKSIVENILSYSGNMIDLPLDDEYQVVIGDRLELFFCQIMLPDVDLDVAVFYTGTGSPYIGEFQENAYYFDSSKSSTPVTLVFALIDRNNIIRGYKSVRIVPIPKITSPSEVKNVLIIGDSYTEQNIWVRELKRRLCDSGGSPEGANLQNIAFIGTKNTSNVPTEGYSGKDWNFFVSENSPFYFNGVVDFDTYCINNGFSKIDYVIILLGANGYPTKEVVKQIIDALLAHNSNIKIVVSSNAMLYGRFGWKSVFYSAALSAGAKGSYYKRDWYKKNMELKSWINEYKSNNINYHDIVQQIDSVNNFGFELVQANSRNTDITVRKNTEDVHPAESGYNQIADSLYTAFNNYFKE